MEDGAGRSEGPTNMNSMRGIAILPEKREPSNPFWAKFFALKTREEKIELIRQQLGYPE